MKSKILLVLEIVEKRFFFFKFLKVIAFDRESEYSGISKIQW